MTTRQNKRKLLERYCIIMTMSFLIVSVLFLMNGMLLSEKYNNLLAEKESVEERNTYLEERIESMSVTITSLMEISTDLESQNRMLFASNEGYQERVEELERREELYDKYEYALYHGDKRTDITYNQLELLEDLVKKHSIPDEDLILAVIMTESSGNEKAKNANSSAKGYGQIIDGTSKFIYCNLMKNNSSEWYSDIAYNGDLNIEMVVIYLSYLYEKNSNNAIETIYSYRGKRSEEYVERINSYLETKNKSIYDLS